MRLWLPSKSNQDEKTERQADGKRGEARSAAQFTMRLYHELPDMDNYAAGLIAFKCLR